jgi:hypothetical protein
MTNMNRVDKSITCSAATGTVTIGTIRGIIQKIEIVASASTDVWIYIDASDVDDGNIVDENVLGVTGTKITVNTTLISYPVVANVVGSTNATTDPDQFSQMIVSGRLELAYASAAADDTLRVVVYYNPIH